jgi:hypothetical protein
MDTIALAFWLAVIAYVAVWCAIFSPLAWLIRTMGGVSIGRARTMAFFACYLGAVLAVVGPLLVVAANNPSFRFPAGAATAVSHERCSSYWCSTLLAVLERP